jgi:hypothetical protein
MLVYSMWETMRALLISGEPIEFDSRVPVNAPANAEGWLNVPVIVDATMLPGIAKTVVFADQKTISRILHYRPLWARPVIGLWTKLQQTTPRGSSAAIKSIPRTTAAERRRSLMPIRIGDAISARSGHRPGDCPAIPDHCSAAAGRFYGYSTAALADPYPITANLAGGSPCLPGWELPACKILDPKNG